jgi:hypothetical protein
MIAATAAASVRDNHPPSQTTRLPIRGTLATATFCQSLRTYCHFLSVSRLMLISKIGEIDMTKLNLILLYIWSALAFAVASKHQLNKPYGEWLKLGLRVAQQQPVPTDLWHFLVLIDPDGRFLHAATILNV